MNERLFNLLHLYLGAEYGDRIAGFLFEPIQGEAGVCYRAWIYLWLRVFVSVLDLSSF